MCIGIEDQMLKNSGQSKEYILKKSNHIAFV